MRPWRVTRRAVVIWTGAVTLAAAFAWAQTTLGCGYFARGGSVMVVYAALIGSLSMRALLDYAQELDEIQAEQVRIAKLMFAEDHDAGADGRGLAESVERMLRTVGRRLGRLRDAAMRFRRLVYVEAPIVFAGTVIWGFGDLWLPNDGCRSFYLP